MTAAVHWSSSALSTFPPSPFPSSYSPPDECSPQQVMHSHHFQLPPPAPPASHNYRSSPASSTTSNTSYQSPASWRSASHTTVPVVLPPARSVPGYGSPNEPRLSPPSQTTTHETFIHSPGAPPDGRPPYGASSFGTPGPGQAHHSAYPASRPRGSFSDHSTNAGGFPNFPDPGPQSHSRSTPSGKGRQNRNRCHLHIRQHPRATRAGPDGKDRRAIDPPPILQLLMDDFDPDNPDDVAEIKSPFWVVHCRLVAARSPGTDMSTMTHQNESGEQELQRLLLGTSVASPTQTSDDPDPETMPQHPITKPRVTAPASPTTRFLPLASRPANRAPREPHQVPGAFFIFADVSVRRAGEYRLQFTLMKMAPETLSVGSTVPSIDVVTSQMFRAVNAKDFDQVKPSTNLVRGLIERGAGFPLKLKKGTRESQRRRMPHSGEDSDNDSGDEDGYYS